MPDARTTCAVATAAFGLTPFWRRAVAVGLHLAAFFLGACSASAVPPLSRDFNGPDTAWQPLESQVPLRLLTHECIADGAHERKGCEHLVLVAPVGQSAPLACETPPVAVVDELEARLWVKASQPGVQLAARVTLPRSIGVRKQPAVSVIIRGERYSRAGRWQQLALTDVPKRLAEQVRVLRTEPGASIDSREAYVDAIVLLVPGGPEPTELWTDDLAVEGVVVDRASGVEPAAYTSAVAPAHSANVRMHGGTLQVDGRAFLPRGIEWHGEPLQFLAERGFNVVELATQPTVEQANDARHHALWFFCPPPRPDVLAETGFAPGSERVVAWSLVDSTNGADPNYVHRWAELVRQRDPMPGRPVVVCPESDWTSAGDAADIVVAQHLLAGRLPEDNYRQWLVGRRPLVGPGLPLWVRLPTQFHEYVGRQCAALGGHAALPPNVDDLQLEALLRVATIERCSGYVFASHRSLAENDAATRRRAELLELVNRRLQLIEPWLAGGKVVGRVQSSDSARTAAVLHVDYARLLMPIPGATDRRDAGPLAGKAFVVPGIPESSQVFQLSPVELRQVPAHRVTGGMRIVWEADDDDLLLLTEDPQVIASLGQRTAQQAAKIARLERDLAAAHAAAIADTARALTKQGIASSEPLRTVAAVNAQLRQVDSLIASGRAVEAFQLVRALKQPLAQATTNQRSAIATSPTLSSNPFGVSYDQLAEHVELARRVDALRGGDNLLSGGDFEDLGQLTTAGWRHVSHPLAGVSASAELSTDRPQHGSYCLALRAIGAAPDQSAPSLASAPIWITSPPVPVEKGRTIEITGWVRIDEPITHSVEGLAIVDSLGGAELTLTVGQTSGWQPFQIIRAVPESTDLRITFALTGLGTARIDGVMVRPLEQPIARRLPAIDGTRAK